MGFINLSKKVVVAISCHRILFPSIASIIVNLNPYVKGYARWYPMSNDQTEVGIGGESIDMWVFYYLQFCKAFFS